MKFTVLISLHEKEVPENFDKALCSVWDDQTLRPAKIVLVIDGPLGQDLESVVGCWKAKIDPANLIVVRLPENLGLGAALNEGLKHCKYDLIARMDTDDISLPDRFEKQIAFMQEHPDVAASSGFIEEWNKSMSTQLGVRAVPVGAQQVLEYAKRRCPLSHPAAIIRKNAILAVGGYPPLRKAQDYALWTLMLQRGYVLNNLKDTLLRMRINGDVSTNRGLSHLKAEYTILCYQKKVGFIGTTDFVINLTLRAVLRLSPAFVRALLYKFGR